MELLETLLDLFMTCGGQHELDDLVAPFGRLEFFRTGRSSGGVSEHGE